MTSRKIPESAVENLVSDLEGKANIALTNSPYTTNRILEIPQNIKLELNNGTLTLKAGSKVYALDGSSYTIPFDKTLDYYNSEPHSSWILVKENGEMDDIWTLESVSSISIGSKWVTFRETNYYLPICVATHNADGTNKNGWKSIDQIFNGFGYIGSTVFALPGVKCQFADGRNEDGSYKSYVKTTDKILTKTFGAETFNGFDCSLVCRNDSIDGFAWHVNEDFDNKSGYIIINKTERIDKNLCPVFRFFINSSSDNGKISQFIPNPVDKLNWKSTELSGLGMPSNRYIGLTLGASKTTYTAPANGWFFLDTWTTSTATAYYHLYNITSDLALLVVPDQGHAYQQKGFIPCKTGDIVALIYSNIDTTKTRWRFIYAEGDQ